MSQKLLGELNSMVSHMEYHNSMAPFPVYSTEYIQDIKDKMNEITKSNENYDDLPVVACRHCKSLHIEVDNEDNDICMKCNSINELIEYKNIYEYKREKNIWND